MGRVAGAEGGRTVLVRRGPDGTTTDLLPAPWNARTRAHEYGGGAWTVADGVVVLTDFADQRLYRVVPAPTPAADPGAGDPLRRRFADLSVTPVGRCCASGRPTRPPARRPTWCTRWSPSADGAVEVLVHGPDFVSDPRLGPDGSLCWLQWQHPDMPWDAAQLVVRAADGAETVVAGGAGESVVQPTWAADGSLLFFADRTGFWSLYRWHPGGEPELLCDPGSDMAGPQWVFGASRFAELADGRVVVAYGRDGADRLAVLDADGPRELDTRYASFAQLRAQGTAVVCVAGGPTSKAEVVRVDVDGGGVQVLRPAPQDVDESFFSRPEHVTFPSTDADGVTEAHALVYPPTNPGFRGRTASGRRWWWSCTAGRPRRRPRCSPWACSTGPRAGSPSPTSTTAGPPATAGPTATRCRAAGASPTSTTWWPACGGCPPTPHRSTCGSTRPRAVIRGGSAGGYTTLAALTFRPGVFAAGASHYGVADLAALARDTHSFESRYLDGLIAPWPSGEAVYAQRSPIHHVDSLDTPLAVFQGAEDRVVPPEQAEMMVAALRDKGVPHAYLLFPGEQHGFRRSENIRASLDGELSFYAQVLGFDLPAEEGIEPVEVVRG